MREYLKFYLKFDCNFLSVKGAWGVWGMLAGRVSRTTQAGGALNGLSQTWTGKRGGKPRQELGPINMETLEQGTWISCETVCENHFVNHFHHQAIHSDCPQNLLSAIDLIGSVGYTVSCDRGY